MCMHALKRPRQVSDRKSFQLAVIAYPTIELWQLGIAIAVKFQRLTDAN